MAKAWTPERLAAHRERLMKVNADPDVRARASDRMKQLNVSPEVTAKQRAIFGSLPQRIAKSVDIRGVANCWIWTGGKNTYGYGRVWAFGAQRMAHRVLYELARGPILEGLQLDHLCRVRNCVNPAHLEPVTAAENLRRAGATAMGRCRRGHQMTDANTYYRKCDSTILCVACKDARVARFKEKKQDKGR